MKRVADHPSGLYFEEPPQKGTGQRKYKERLVALSAYPNRWAVIGSGSKHAMTAARAYWLKQYPGEFELVTRKSGTVYKLYARYVAGGNDGAQ